MSIQVIREVLKAINESTNSVEDLIVEYAIQDGVYFLLEDGMEIEDQSFETLDDMMFIVHRSIEDFGYKLI